MKHDLLLFHIFVSKFEGWNGQHFYSRPRTALSLAMPLPMNKFSYFKIHKRNRSHCQN